jgi:hypothetical protein
LGGGGGEEGGDWVGGGGAGGTKPFSSLSSHAMAWIEWYRMYTLPNSVPMEITVLTGQVTRNEIAC